MSILSVLGLSLALLASDRPVGAQPAVVRSTVAAGPRVRPTGLVISPRDPRAVSIKPVSCVQWYYPAPAVFSQSSGTTETFWLSGIASILLQYDGHPERIHLTDTTASSANPWTVTSATWDGSAWLIITATHGDVGGAPTPPPIVGGRLPTPQVPSKSLPPAPAPGTVGGTLSITLDPIDGGSVCASCWFYTYYTMTQPTN